VKKVGRRGSVWVGIIVVAVFFACVTLAVAALGGGPDIPHATTGNSATCTSCHPVTQLPAGHEDRVEAGCRSCHSAAGD
jgi:flagellar basal body-associated protein FliL